MILLNGFLILIGILITLYVIGWAGEKLLDEWSEGFWETVGNGFLYTCVISVLVMLSLILGSLI